MHQGQVNPLAELSADRPPDVDMTRSYGPHLKGILAGEKIAKAFLGVSLKNRMANRTNLQKTIPWLARHSSFSLVVIGDMYYRHNLIALRNLSVEVATEAAIREGQRTQRAALRVIEEFGVGDRVATSTAAELMRRDEYAPILQMVRQLFEASGEFAEDIQSSAREYLKRVHNAGRRDSAKLTVLKEFVLEEVALSLQLYAQGFILDVYPGDDLPALQGITSGRYPGSPFRCSDRTFISLDLSNVTPP